jgi:hypothetical protein
VHGNSFLRPSCVGLTSRTAGYVAGLKLSAPLYLLVLIVLAIAATCEAASMVVMVRFASGGGNGGVSMICVAGCGNLWYIVQKEEP